MRAIWVTRFYVETRVNVSIPLSTTSENGFFNHRETPQRQLLSYAVKMRIQQPYYYLEFQDVPLELAAELLDRIRVILPWAALRLDFGILAAGGDLRVADGPTFDGQFATAYPVHLAPAPIRVASNHRSEEADARLFSALSEGAELEHLIGPSPQPELKLACEIFASVDFEASNNAVPRADLDPRDNGEAGTSPKALPRHHRRRDGPDEERGRNSDGSGASSSAFRHAQGRDTLEVGVD
ncbi:hypothetical protein IVA80_27610 [Bradyrhizobium sp. 139]|uniref:hypothetical protein n=1 Tax=Bradyrhizobium sp. 139 TaxID=2782616 RepID=UPI001FFBD179|nr:hypothetical protein [Bradyrhizobium sp. 139]MCK1744478.1 hypothetical protein [Bradyrhizobium sp. 139]